MLRVLIISFILIVINNILFSQKKGINDTIRVLAVVTENNDTIPFEYLEPVEVLTTRILTKEQTIKKQEFTRLRNAVYVTYPYAKASARIMNEINAKLAGVNDKKKRKQIIKSREKELRKEFASKISDLSIYQGKVMMKLIYRETGNSCYEIIEEYKGGFTATLYQTIAVIVGTNLKQLYDKNGLDKEIETIVVDLEKMYGYR